MNTSGEILFHLFDELLALSEVQLRHDLTSVINKKKGSSVCVMQWTGVIRDGTLI
jgi:hypothetical protein